MAGGLFECDGMLLTTCEWAGLMKIGSAFFILITYKTDHYAILRGKKLEFRGKDYA